MKRFVLLIIVSILMLIMGANFMTIHATGVKTVLDSGLTLFGPYGDGHSTYGPNKQVYAGEIHTVGWSSLEPQEGVYDWSEIDNYLSYYSNNGKKASIRIQSAGHSTREIPRWLYDNYGVRQITAQGVFFNFADGEAASLTSLRKLGVNGSEEYTAIRTGGTIGGGSLSCSVAGSVVIESTKHLNSYNSQIGFDYSGVGTVQITVVKNGVEKIVKSFMASVNKQSAMFLISKSEFDYNSTIKIKVLNGSIKFDNVSISAQAGGVHNTDRNLCYPNYFDPIYIQKYTNLVKAFANRYKDNPSIAAIVVGGFGRWDELSMMGDDYYTEDALLKKQWTAYGYDDNKFIAHINTICQLFSTELSDYKDIILHIAAFSLPHTGLGTSSGDTNYVGFAVNNLSKKYGFMAKTNGLSEKLTEWDQAQYGFNYFANRYKYDDNSKFILEEGGQINNPIAYWMGHPISLFNRVLTDQIDNYWFYSTDLKLPFIMKYAHTANEQAGNALFTRQYNILKKTLLRADSTNWDGSPDDRVLRNLWNGLYLSNNGSDQLNDEHKNNYDVKVGREVIKTSTDYPNIKFSLDDRQSYNVLYGGILAVTYFDIGSDTLTIKIANETLTRTLTTITKTNSGTFKTSLLYAGDFFDTKNNGDGAGVQYELTISSNSDGMEYVSGVEINSVPSIDWSEDAAISPTMPATPVKESLTKSPTTIKTFDIIPNKPLSSIDINVGTTTTGYVKFQATVSTVIGTAVTTITTKEYYMPGENDMLRIPIAKATYKAEKYRVEIKCLQGSGYIYKDASGQYAYFAKTYKEATGASVAVNNNTVGFDALQPFFGFRLSSVASSTIKLQKQLGANWIDIFITTDTGMEKLVTFEPQTAGQYRIIHTGASQAVLGISQLVRHKAANSATRENLGLLSNSNFKSLADTNAYFWQAVSGFKNKQTQNGIWSAELTGANPSIVTTRTLNITPDNSQIFHFAIKNETASDMVKVYWKNEGDDDYSEQKVVYIPIVPNDSEFREYSYPIGREASRYYFESFYGIISDKSTFTYADITRGAITGFKVVPVVGETVTAGRISIATMDLREDNNENYTFKEPFNVISLSGDSKTTGINEPANPQHYTNLNSDWISQNSSVWVENTKGSLCGTVPGTSNTYVISSRNPTLTIGDYIFETEFTTLSDTNDDLLVFSFKNNSVSDLFNGFFIQINRFGSVFYDKSDGTFLSLPQSGRPDLINYTNGIFNKIKVIFKSNKVDYYINGTLQLSGYTLKVSNVDAGIVMGGTTTTSTPTFRNIKVTNGGIVYYSFKTNWGTIDYDISLDNVIFGLTEKTSKAVFVSKIHPMSDVAVILLDENRSELADDANVGTGDILEVNTGSEIINCPILIKGDVDGDGEISIADLAEIKQNILKSGILEGICLKAGDINADTIVTISDLLAVKKHLLGELTINQD